MLEKDQPGMPLKGSFKTPDEIRDSDLDQIRIVQLDNVTFIRRTSKPRPKLPTIINNLIGAKSYKDTHILFQLKGRIRYKMGDGTEKEYGPGEVGIIPEEHNSWVVGNKSATTLEIVIGDTNSVPKTVEQQYTFLEKKEERRDIRQSAESFIAAMNTHDARNVIHFFANDAEFINVGGGVIHGAAAIERYFTDYFQHLLPRNYLFKISGDHNRLIAPNVINVDLYWHLIDSHNPSQSIPYNSGLLILIMAKSQAEWRIQTMHSMSIEKTGEQNDVGEIIFE